MPSVMTPLLLAVAMLFGVARGSDVVVGSGENFDKLVQADGAVAVMFYAPWCGHCMKLAPHWETTATELKRKGKATLVKVDAMTELELSEKYNVMGFPTIMAWVDGDGPHEYDGEHNKNEIIAWIERLTAPAVRSIAGPDELEKERKKHPILTLGIFPEGHDAAPFHALAKKYKLTHAFVATSSEDLAQAHGVKAPAVVIFNSIDDKVTAHTGDLSYDALASFHMAEGYPLLTALSEENFRMLQERGAPMAWLVIDPSAEDTPAVKAALLEATKDIRQNVTTVWLDGVEYAEMASHLALQKGVLPALSIEYGGHHYTYQNKPFTVEGLREFFMQWLQGTMAPSFKSQEVPENPTVDGVTTVVRKTFDAYMREPSKNVFYIMYSPGYSEHSDTALAEVEKLGKHFEHHPTVMVVKYDAVENDVPHGFTLEGIPTLGWVKAGTDKDVRYDGIRDFQSMLAFIEEKLG